MRNEVLYECQLICDLCFVYNKYFFDVNVVLIKLVEDVKEGDIVCFFYYYFLYDVVVLKNEGFFYNKIVVILFIVYYVFCGINEYKIIKREKMEFCLDGLCVNVLYILFKFFLYYFIFVVK